MERLGRLPVDVGVFVKFIIKGTSIEVVLLAFGRSARRKCGPGVNGNLSLWCDIDFSLKITFSAQRTELRQLPRIQFYPLPHKVSEFEIRILRPGTIFTGSLRMLAIWDFVGGRLYCVEVGCQVATVNY